jgi:hypothetical protein
MKRESGTLCSHDNIGADSPVLDCAELANILAFTIC